MIKKAINAVIDSQEPRFSNIEKMQTIHHNTKTNIYHVYCLEEVLNMAKDDKLLDLFISIFRSFSGLEDDIIIVFINHETDQKIAGLNFEVNDAGHIDCYISKG